MLRCINFGCQPSTTDTFEYSLNPYTQHQHSASQHRRVHHDTIFVLYRYHTQQ